MGLEQKIFAEIKRGNKGAYEDLFQHIVNTDNHKLNKKLREEITKNMSIDIPYMFSLYEKTLLFDAPNDLDSFLLYMELGREPSERFYQPRRKILKRAVDEIQRLADNELDELFLSMPPRVGKTSLLMFTTCWLMGKDSEKTNLYSAYSDLITKAFYNGVLEVIYDKDTYRWRQVFPESEISRTNAQDETIDVDRKKRYPTLTCRSLYGTLNGACDCSGFLISDDLIGSIEEAMNKDRLVNTWAKVDNNLIPRAKEKAKVLWCGTRWSVSDPAGIRMSLLAEDEQFKNRRWEVINLSALDENEESNFDYLYGVGFSTDYYKQRRASFEKNNDIASWDAQYMGMPIEREGALFNPEDLRYYNGVLPENPDRVFMAVDPAFGGGDYVASPIVYQYGEDFYVDDVVYSNDDKKITQPLIVSKVIKHDVRALQIEANKSTEAYKDGIENELKEKGYHLNIISKAAPSNASKDQRIFDAAPDIRDHFVFRESGKRSKEYNLFMQNVYSFKMYGKNKHDDAPDSLAMARDMAFARSRKVEVFKRPF